MWDRRSGDRSLQRRLDFRMLTPEIGRSNLDPDG
jgi:hypothetical protein